MQDLKTSIALEMADSPMTTKGIMLLGVGSFADLRWYEYMPMFFSLTGSAIAGIAGVWLFMRHRSQHKLNKLTAIKVQLEIDELMRLKAEASS